VCKLQCWAVIRNLNMPIVGRFLGITAGKGPGSRSSFRVAGSKGSNFFWNCCWNLIGESAYFFN